MANTAHTADVRNHTRRVSSETKASYKTTEFIVFIVVALAVLLAAAFTDTSDFGTQEAWFYVTLLSVGYMISRGLAKAGSRDFHDDAASRTHSDR